MNTTHSSMKRKGAALLIAIMAMAVITLILSVLVTQIVTQRRMVRHRHRQLQAEWLARSGVEYGAARLLTQAEAFTDDKQEFAPDSKVHVVVEKAGKDAFDVTVEAKVGLEGVQGVVRTSSARFRRTDKGGAIRVEPIDR